MVEHAVFLHVPVDGERAIGPNLDRLTVLCAEVDGALRAARAGEVDGTEVLDHEWILFAYGRSGEAMLDALNPVLRRWRLPAGSALLVRHGDLADADAVELPVALPDAEAAVSALDGSPSFERSSST